jgi:hypothetical protein
MPGWKSGKRTWARGVMRRLARTALLLIACSGAPMIHGCAQNEPPKVVDLAQYRCPPIAAADARALSQHPSAPPAGDMTDAQARPGSTARTRRSIPCASPAAG